MDLFERRAMDLGLRLGEASEDCDGLRFRTLGHLGTANDFENMREMAMGMGWLVLDDDRRGAKASPMSLFDRETTAWDIERLDHRIERTDGNARVDQCAESHVAANSADAIEVRDP
jgi:hypothetical protein